MEELIIALIVIAIVVFICVKFSSNSNKNAIALRTSEPNNVGNKNQNQIQQNKQVRQSHGWSAEKFRQICAAHEEIIARQEKTIAELKLMNQNRKDNFLPDNYNQANVDEASQAEANQPELDEAAGPIYEKPAH